MVAMIRWPEKLEPGKYDSVSSYIDLLPTISSAAGQTPVDNVDGIDLLPYLSRQREPINRAIILGERTVVSELWKLKDGKFYDLKNDPNEKTDVSNPPKEVATFLRAELAKFGQLQGPQIRSRLPKPKQWPPKNWMLPEETGGVSE